MSPDILERRTPGRKKRRLSTGAVATISCAALIATAGASVLLDSSSGGGTSGCESIPGQTIVSAQTLVDQSGGLANYLGKPICVDGISRFIHIGQASRPIIDVLNGATGQTEDKTVFPGELRGSLKNSQPIPLYISSADINTLLADQQAVAVIGRVDETSGPYGNTVPALIVDAAILGQ